MKRKAIIISAPSGAGKTTIVKYLLKEIPELAFSVSACSRKMRAGEVDGKDYHFLTVEDFRNRIAEDAFVEWEEVYTGSYYGTLKSELERIWSVGRFPLFEVDIKGGLKLKNYFGDQALSIFIRPPAFEDLERRLRNRNTESEVDIRKRIAKAREELTFAERFDRVIINARLEKACEETFLEITGFLQIK
jgi:guanylate kinase